MLVLHFIGLAAQVSWLGLRAGRCLALISIHQMNQVRLNSHNDLS